MTLASLYFEMGSFYVDQGWQHSQEVDGMGKPITRRRSWHLRCSGFSGSFGFESHLMCRTCCPPHREGQALGMAEVPERMMP